jgi:hypothetical protein
MIETNERGGRQSRIKGRFTEVPPEALIEISKVMGEGSKAYPREPDGSPNWHKIDCYSNLDHAIEHLANFLAARNVPKTKRPLNGYMKEELSHFAARAMMALEQYLREEQCDAR